MMKVTELLRLGMICLLYTSYLAISNATNLLGDAEFVDVTPEDDNLQIYQFKNGNEGILAVWTVSYTHLIKQINDDVVFGDEDSISDWAKDACDILQKAGIISGMDNGNFEPKSGTTRAQAAMVVYKTLMNN